MWDESVIVTSAPVVCCNIIEAALTSTVSCLCQLIFFCGNLRLKQFQTHATDTQIAAVFTEKHKHVGLSLNDLFLGALF